MHPYAILRWLVVARRYYNLAGELRTAKRIYDALEKHDDTDQLFTIPVFHELDDELIAHYLMGLLWYRTYLQANGIKQPDKASFKKFTELYLIQGIKASHMILKSRSADASPSDVYALVLKAIPYAYTHVVAPAWDSTLAAYSEPNYIHPTLANFIITYGQYFIDSPTFKNTIADLIRSEAKYEKKIDAREVEIQLAILNQTATRKTEVDALKIYSRNKKMAMSAYLPLAMYYSSLNVIDKMRANENALSATAIVNKSPFMTQLQPANYGQSRREVSIGKFTPTIKLRESMLPADLEDLAAKKEKREINLGLTTSPHSKTIEEGASTTDED